LAISGINSASVPEAHVMQYFTPTYFARASSNSKTFFPSIKSLSSKIVAISRSTSSLINWYCLFKSMNLIL